MSQHFVITPLDNQAYVFLQGKNYILNGEWKKQKNSQSQQKQLEFGKNSQSWQKQLKLAKNSQGWQKQLELAKIVRVGKTS